MCGGIDIRVWNVCVEFLLSSIELFDLFYVFIVTTIYGCYCVYGFIVPPFICCVIYVEFIYPQVDCGILSSYSQVLQIWRIGPKALRCNVFLMLFTVSTGTTTTTIPLFLSYS